MKKLLFIPLMLLAFAGIGQTAKKKTVDSTTSTSKYKDNIDDRMKGPNGEKVYIGPSGGRYYMKGTTKVYIQSKASKKKPA